MKAVTESELYWEILVRLHRINLHGNVPGFNLSCFCSTKSMSLSLSVSGHFSHLAAGSGSGAADFVQSGSPVEGGGQQPAE